MRSIAPLFSRLLVLVVISGLLSSCALTNRLFRNDAAEAAAEALLQLQLDVMRFADEYTARINDQVVVFQRETDDPSERLMAQTWLATQATSAFTIATGPNPELNAIDMLVFVVLSRMVIDDFWVDERYGARADGLRAVHQALENRAWGMANQLLSPAQSSELKASIDAWHRQNPNQRAVAYIHLDDFAFATRSMRTDTGGSGGSVFSFFGLDPLSNLDPAVRQIAQARQLAERALFYAQRTPQLVVMETQRLVFALAVTPEAMGLLQNVGRLSVAAQQTSTLAAGLPDILAKERAATIDQLTGVLDSRQTQLQGLIVELRSTLEAGTATSDSLKGTIASLDTLVARFERPTSETASPRQPFDITQYTETARELGIAAQQLQELLNQVDNNVPALTQLSNSTSDRVESLVDHMFWRLVQLVLVLIAASLFGALGYRAIVRRWNRSPPS
jgi:hypothetical protein